MIAELPEQLLAQAEFLVRSAVSNQANLRRAVSSAYYALFHLLVRDAIANWKHTEHHARLARAFEHKRMKEASAALVREIGDPGDLEDGDAEQDARNMLANFAETFVELQHARHAADYDISGPLDGLEAAIDVARARPAFQSWTEIKDHPLAQRYLYTLLFKDRS